MRRVVAGLALGLLAVALVPTVNAAPAGADEIVPVSHLDPWSIDGALFASGSVGIRNVDIPGACADAYAIWEADLLEAHANIEATFIDEYDRRIAANQDAIAAGEPQPYPALPPDGSMSERLFVNSLMNVANIPSDPMDWVKQEWEVMEVAPGTSIPCTGKGYLPAPPGGFLGINLGDEPPDPDPCAPRGQLPFSPAVWTWYPSWHEDAPGADEGNPHSGIQSFYDIRGGKIIFSFIPIVLGVELVVDCLAIFPGAEASDRFEEALPAAELTVVPKDVGVTGVDTKLWYNFADPNSARLGPLTVGFDHRGTTWRLTAYAWVDAVGWDLDFDGSGDPVWDESIDFPDTEWIPAPSSEYATMGGSLESPAREYVYESKDYYTIATGVTWRGYYIVEEIGGLGWGFSELYDPVTRWTVLPYQVDEIVGRRN